MSGLLPVAAPQGPASRLNPAAKLGAATVLMLGLIVTVDLVTPGLVLAAELAAAVALRLRLRALMVRMVPVLDAPVSVGLVHTLFGAPSGPTLIAVGPVTVTEGAALGAAAVVVRLVAIALPGVFFAATTDPVDLADSLVQQLRVPARFAYGALAPLRLLPLLVVEWQSIGRARRARGIDAGWSPVAALRLFGGQVFGLLVTAIRRGIRLAAAMDARGFDARRRRTVARPQRVRRADWLLIAAAVAVVGVATGVSVALGTYHPLIS